MKYTDSELTAMFADGDNAVLNGAASIKVIFDNQYQTAVDIGGFAGVESSGPAAICKTADVAAAKHEDTLEISGITYFIRGIEPDGTGITILRLSKEAV